MTTFVLFVAVIVWAAITELWRARTADRFDRHVDQACDLTADDWGEWEATL